MNFVESGFLERVIYLIPMLLSLTVHEWAHARSAYALGDDTASAMGRMSLNPLVHMDVVGTIVLPLLGVPFGWAKPVPVNPLRFYHRYNMRWGMMVTAAAGPAANVALAILAAGTLSILAHTAPAVLSPRSGIGLLLSMLVSINIALAVFNLIPVPPLDGSRLADYFMPQPLRPYWDTLYRSGPFGLVLVFVALQFFGGVLSSVIAGVMRLLYAMVGL